VFLANYLGFAYKLFGGLAEYMTGGYYFPIAILLILEINLIEIIKKRILKVLIFLNILVLIILSVLENVRGNWIALIVAIIFSFIISWSRRRFLINIAIVLAILLVLFAVAGMIKPQLFESTLNEIRSIKSLIFKTNEGNTIAIANTNWRIITWKGYLQEFLRRPVFGWGFGRKFLANETFDMGWNTGLADNWVATHNYIISFLYISGVAGLLAFGLIIVNFFRRNIRFLKSAGLINQRYLVAAFLSCIVYILILGSLEVVMEVPYQGIFLWVFLAFNMIIIKDFYNKKNENITNS
jgi:O-antigen ligase